MILTENVVKIGMVLVLVAEEKVVVVENNVDSDDDTLDVDEMAMMVDMSNIDACQHRGYIHIPYND